MFNWKERFKSSPDAALCFANELRSARLGALADAEGWMPLVLAFERLGKYLVSNRTANLGKARSKITDLAKSGAVRFRVGSNDSIPIEMLVKLVIDGRNEEFHGGSAARRFTSHCLELGILLEDGLKSFLSPMKLKYVMTPNPTCAELDLPLYHARQLMLEGSFTWLPASFDGNWIGISDHAIVTYTNNHLERYGKTTRSAIKGAAESRLTYVPLNPIDGETTIIEAIAALADRPVLISANGTDRIIGIVTAFDLL